MPCGIPYIYGTIKQVDKNIIPDEGFIQQGIRMHTVGVESIDRAAKTAFLADDTSIAYDKLILATGSRPVLPPIPGIETQNVFCIHKDPEYLQNLQGVLQSARRIVVVGGGFIGVEMAEQIVKMTAASEHAVEVSLIELLPNCLMLACEQEFCADAEKSCAIWG